MGDNNKTWVSLAAMGLVIISILSFQFALYSSTSKISNLEKILEERKSEFSELTSPIEPSPAIKGDDINCHLCHDLIETKKFHLPQNIMLIDERKGKRRRVCIDCHGPKAFDSEGNFLGWNANMQMTPLSMISFKEDEGLNGEFQIPPSVPHAIHERVLNSLKIIYCNDCHQVEGKIERPRADVSKGQVLVCQNCKYHPEQGNYIKIHLEDGGRGCFTCHVDSIIELHRERTYELGKLT